MNISMTKLAMLEKSMLEIEEAEKNECYTTSPYEKELRLKITDLLDKVRLINPIV